MVKISIIVPIYNAEKYIGECIKSVLCQSFEAYELLLINDGSTDDSEQICKHFVEKDDRVKLFSKSNGGQPSALNYGLDRASGKYIMFLDADDYWCDNDILSKMYEAAELNNLDIIRGECQEVNNQGDVLIQYSGGEYKERYEGLVVDSCFFIDKLVDRKYFMVLYLIKKSALGDLRYNTNRVFLQDAELNLSLCSKNLRCMYIHDIFYSYRKHEEAITVKPHPQKLYDAFDFSRFCFRLSKESEIDAMKLFCAKEGVRNFLFDLCVIAIEWPWSDIRESYNKYDLNSLRKEAKAFIQKYSLKGKNIICYLPLPAIICYYKLKNILHVIIKKIIN